MIELLKEAIINPSLLTVLLLLTAGLLYVLWTIIAKRLNLTNPSYDEVVNERAKDLINSLAERVENLEATVAILKNELSIEKEENLRLAMLNALILNSKMIIKGLPIWVFSYPENKAMYLSEEYKVFLAKGITIADYINEYNSKIWNTEIANIFNYNNSLAAKHGFWLGYEKIVVDGVDVTYDWLILKVGIKNDLGRVDKVFGMALKVTSKTAKAYLKAIVEHSAVKKI